LVGCYDLSVQQLLSRIPMRGVLLHTRERAVHTLAEQPRQLRAAGQLRRLHGRRPARLPAHARGVHRAEQVLPGRADAGVGEGVSGGWSGRVGAAAPPPVLAPTTVHRPPVLAPTTFHRRVLHLDRYDGPITTQSQHSVAAGRGTPEL